MAVMALGVMTGTLATTLSVINLYDRIVTRWAPDADLRLKAAAFELFADRGFVDVTVSDIAERAGVTKRTFFRHFATKEDVLFTDGPTFLGELVAAMRATPNDTSPRNMLLAAVHRLGEIFEAERQLHRERALVIGTEPTLRERELLMDQQWSDALAAVLVERGTPRTNARVLAATITTTFRVVYDDWVRDRSRTSLAVRTTNALTGLTEDLGGSAS
jgi:AcrR family transcriptional regulator